jgi:hypothetical protein
MSRRLEQAFGGSGEKMRAKTALIPSAMGKSLSNDESNFALIAAAGASLEAKPNTSSGKRDKSVQLRPHSSGGSGSTRLQKHSHATLPLTVFTDTQMQSSLPHLQVPLT